MVSKTKTKKHHLHHLHFRRVTWFVVMGIGLTVINVIPILNSSAGPNGKVLAYATNVSNGGLLSATNAARASNGKSALNGHGQLNSSAQAKANDMIAKDYWAHNSPSGTTPWYWITKAGYRYAKAGENLAYGFDSSSQINNAWMNSSGHRYNVLGDYKDVGFGIANGKNYQGGKYTVVVAHYGNPYYVSSPPKSTTTKPKPTTTTTKPKPTKTTAKPKPTTQPEEGEEVAAAPDDESKAVSNFDTLLGGQAGWAIYSSLGLIGLTSVGFASTHWQLVRRGWKASGHFILVHPALDAAFIAAIVAILLTASAGFIK